MLERLQKHGFEYDDLPLEQLLEKYCTWDEKKKTWKGCKIALMWWSNANGGESDSVMFNIKRNKWLKEFMILNPPNFKISNKCCSYAKKKVMHNCIHKYGYDLNITGVRKLERGVRTVAYKSCFDENSECDNYRPLYWYSDQDKEDYENNFGVEHSKCYTEYGLKRTGCAGCPFGRDFEFELEVIQKYEPKLYKAVNNIFGDSYEYTRRYKEFCKEMDEKYGSYARYLESKTN